MYDIVNTSPFLEHPIVDISQFDAHEFDITIFEEEQPSNFLNGGVFQKELYCKCLLHKLFTLTKSKIKPLLILFSLNALAYIELKDLLYLN